MQFASRDANICQFYGASFQGDDMMLVVELMEVRIVRAHASAFLITSGRTEVGQSLAAAPRQGLPNSIGQ